MKITSLSFGLLVLVLGLILGSACAEPVKPYALGEDCDNYVLARVGDVDITLLDLLEKPQTFSLIQEGLITNEIVRQEAARRGIDVDMDAVQAQMDDMIAGYGSTEAFLDQVGTTMPRSLIMSDVRDYFILQEMKNAILEHEYETTQTPVPEEKILEFWVGSESAYQNQVGAEKGMDPELVTMDDCRYLLEDTIKQQWLGEQSMTFFLDLRTETDFEFYLFDVMNGRESVDIPEIENELEEEPVVEEVPQLTPEEQAELEAEGTHIPLEDLVQGND